MPYSEVEDLLIGDLALGPTVDPAKFVAQAAEEMDAKLGYVYELPLAPLEGAELPLHERLLLKGINNKLASGRLILSIDIAEEGQHLHAYGLRLVTEATNELIMLANGTAQLSAARLDPLVDRNKVPGVANRDAESAVDMFENHVLRGEPSWWSPGEVQSRVMSPNWYFR